MRPAPPAAGPRRSPRRTSTVITVGAALVAVWLGLTAPQVSPVAPPVAQVVTSAPAPVTTAPQTALLLPFRSGQVARQADPGPAAQL